MLDRGRWSCVACGQTSDLDERDHADPLSRWQWDELANVWTHRCGGGGFSEILPPTSEITSECVRVSD